MRGKDGLLLNVSAAIAMMDLANVPRETIPNPPNIDLEQGLKDTRNIRNSYQGLISRDL